MAAAVEGAQVGFDDALTIEGRYFVELACGQVSKNMITAFFFAPVFAACCASSAWSGSLYR